MTSSTTEAQLDQLVKARWLAIGISQSDLAEVLGAAFKQRQDDGERPEAGRLRQIADALELPLELRANVSNGQNVKAGRNRVSLQQLLDLRLLRAFRELQDNSTKRMLIELAEQIVKRQANRRGDAG